jgi:enoyl-CoA hydratase/carnithine racemase
MRFYDITLRVRESAFNGLGGSTMPVDRSAEAPAGVALLRLARPEARNALDLAMREELAAQLEAIEGDDAVRATVVTGDTKAFAAGADLKMIAEARPLDVERLGLHRLWRRVADHPKPLVAAVNGYAFGAGCELALHCDLIVAGPGTRFALPEIKVGIMPGAGGTQRLVRAVGKPRAMRMLLTGDPIDGATAERWGLASELAASDEAVLPTALGLAETIAARAPLAARMIKEAVLEGADLPLDAALALERKSNQLLFDTADQKECMAAFLEKRRPEITGR